MPGRNENDSRHRPRKRLPTPTTKTTPDTGVRATAELVVQSSTVARARLLPKQVPSQMNMTIGQRSERIAFPIPIQYRRPGDADWRSSTVVNLSDSGVL